MLDTLPSLRSHAVLIGHFPAALLDRLPGNYRGAVMLRNPVQRALSALAHMARVHAELIPAILPHVQRDLVLYEHALRRFENDVSRVAGPDHDAGMVRHRVA